MSSSAIQTKFEHHHQQGSEVVRELEEILEQEEKDILANGFVQFVEISTGMPCKLQLFSSKTVIKNPQ